MKRVGREAIKEQLKIRDSNVVWGLGERLISDGIKVKAIPVTGRGGL
jgi:hypothetical protein